MSSNIFIKSNNKTIGEIFNISIKINVKLLLEEFVKNENSYFFFLSNQNLSFSKISSIEVIDYDRNVEEKKDFKSNEIVICSANNLIKLILSNELQEISIEKLKELYSKSNKRYIGFRAYSLSESIKNVPFIFALPYIDENLFLKKNGLQMYLFENGDIIPYNESSVKTYGRVCNENNELYISLTNDKMIELDFNYFYEQQNRETYRPYFYEFFLNEESESLLRRIVINDEIDTRFIYEVKLFDEKIKFNYDIFDEEVLYLQGELIFSASPIRSIPAYIKIISKVTDEKTNNMIKKIEDFDPERASSIKNVNEIEKVINEHIQVPTGTIINYKIIVNDVGQGNWIDIFFKEKDKQLAHLVFDIGIGRINKKKKKYGVIYQNCMNASAKINENTTFILSHWDMDHILGVTTLKKEQFYTQWIAPQLPKRVSNGARRLAAFLTINSNADILFISDSLNDSNIFINDYFELSKGKGTSTTYTKENNSGLILVLKTINKQMLLPGDCDYGQFPIGLTSKRFYDAMLISHHGANIHNLNSINLGFSSKLGLAIATVGEKTGYPSCNHKKQIENAGFVVKNTRDEGNIELVLT